MGSTQGMAEHLSAFLLLSFSNHKHLQKKYPISSIPLRLIVQKGLLELEKTIQKPVFKKKKKLTGN